MREILHLKNLAFGNGVCALGPSRKWENPFSRGKLDWTSRVMLVTAEEEQIKGTNGMDT